jgi:2-keto-4-pentenoate hydratase/2-oxohepta-3-ene-1,7-dioic acid hydratase in catechol pathway
MIFDVAPLVYLPSQVTVLEPGDLINTGTPEGVRLSDNFPCLRDSDVMTLEIDSLGMQEQHLRSAVA